MIPVAEARAFVLAGCRPLSPCSIGTGRAAGLVLAASVHAPHDVPSFANSAMDGYALRSGDTQTPPARLQVVGTVMAGGDPSGPVGGGEAVRIMTGAPMPPGADAVCMVERTRTEEGGMVVVVETEVERGTSVRYPGEDIAAGSEVFGPGTALAAAHLGVLASIGTTEVLVHPRPRVGVASTGDELASGSGPLAPGKIRDANRPALLAQLAADGFDPVDLGTAGDDEDALTRVFEDGGARCDAVVATGGVSVGDHDLAKVVLRARCGQSMRWMQVAVKPAKPFAFGTLASSGVPVFGLPGNPVSALVSYELFVRPALRALAGHRTLDRPRFAATAEAPLRRRRDGKLHLLRVAARLGADGTLRVRPSGGQGSHLLRAMAGASGLAVVPDGDGVPEGGRVSVLLFDADRLGPEPDPRSDDWGLDLGTTQPGGRDRLGSAAPAGEYRALATDQAGPQPSPAQDPAG